MALRNSTLFLGRLVCINRSDDFYKWDPRDQQYMRLYDGKGNLIVEGTLSQQLNQMIMADGFMEINYKDPKDPRKVGLWSDTTTVRPIRIASVLSTN